MLERLIIRNFKRFEEVEIELGQAVLFVGPNNAGKTSALQALALWELGLRRWNEKRGDQKSSASKRSGVTINRRDLVAIPVPESNLFWRGRRVRRQASEEGRKKTENIRIEIEVHGVVGDQQWTCGLEFDFANAESIYCRPLGWSRRAGDLKDAIPEQALDVKIAYLPAMSGLAANETRLDPGAIQVRLGEGRTAEVLRNLCYQIHDTDPDQWHRLVSRIKSLFGITLQAPEYIPERGEIAMRYEDIDGISLDLSAAGRGLQQTLLLLAWAFQNSGAVLLFDEPDAHLEILRQRQIYQTLTEVLRDRESQLIAASHSEVLLNEAADRDVVVAFVGTPHRIDDRGTQVRKSLKSIGYENYYQAEQTGWVLYLEGSTDLAILRVFAEALNHEAQQTLERPFVQYIENQIAKANDHFYGLREAKKDLVGIAILDRQDSKLSDRGELRVEMWERREIENYLCFPEALKGYAASRGKRTGDGRLGPLFAEQEAVRLTDIMKKCIAGRVAPDALANSKDPWWLNVKASDEFLDLVFDKFFSQQNLPNLMRKTDYHELARFVPRELIAQEVVQKLDAIVEIAGRARPRV